MQALTKPFHIYRSSAGSGKTRTLAREYILLAFRHPDYFKYILAVTFANKSSQEMKDRILRYLGDFSKGKGGDLGREVQTELNWDEPTLREKSREVLTRILHGYSQFSISTIDAFFQRVIRSFTRESGLLGNFRLEVENELVLDEVIAELMDELGASNPQLTQWVIQFSSERLTEGESWNITDALKVFASEIFKDSYKPVGEDIQRVKEKISYSEFLNTLKKVKGDFMAFMKVKAGKAMQLLASQGIVADDFNYKDVGTAFKYFRDFANGEYVEAKPRILGAAADASDWAAKKGPRHRDLKQLAELQLMRLLNEMIDFDKRNFVKYNSADVVEKNFFQYGLLSDISRKLKDYKAENNLMLLSDASHFLNGVISGSDTPFIYEKVGSFYRNYLIDEFQDTSELQWKNFRPLLREGLDQNNRSLVVGDVKQSVYRWRGSELELLQEQAELEVGMERTEKHVLNQNWRSAENLVDFNNTLFSTAAQRVSQATQHPLPSDAYNDTRQAAVKYKGKGFIRIQFLERWSSKEDENGEECALRQVPLLMEELQTQGIPLHDIAILVRKNEEGQRIATSLLQYKTSPLAKSGCKYDVVSNESLRLDTASAVLLLISALKYLNNPSDSIARGELVYEHCSRSGSLMPDQVESMFGHSRNRSLTGLLPEEFMNDMHWLVKLSLVELTETLIRVFALGDDKTELAYLQAFQDLVLEFVAREKNDIASFLEWWEDMKEKKSIQVAASTDAARIYTIHGAKGLQFNYVIVPFCSWTMGHDKTPLVWCKSAEKPFDELGYVAVRYTKNLEQSFFAEDYRREFTKAHLDNLNLLYVAFTRAEAGMIVMAPKPARQNEEGKLQTIGQLLYECILGSEELRKNYDEGNSTFTIGKMEVLGDREERDRIASVLLDHYPAFDWRKKLVIRREGSEFFQEEKTHLRQRINYGILLHKALSRIQYKNEVTEVLNGLNFEGVIMEEEGLLLKEKLATMMNHPVIGNWFGKEWHVLTEAPVIIPGGRSGRLDRVIFKEVQQKGQTRKKAVIIDYKTGAKKTEDRRQVEEYARILSEMGYIDVEAYLLYLDNLDIVLVVDKMNLNLF